MLRQSPPRLLIASIFCALCLTVGSLPATAMPGIDSSASRFEVESILVRFWSLVREPVASLFAAAGTEPPLPPTPPTSNSGITIDPSGLGGGGTPGN